MILEALHQVLRHVQSGFVVKALAGIAIHLSAGVLNPSSDFLSSFAGKLSFKARSREIEIESETEVPAVDGVVKRKAPEEEPLALAEVHIDDGLGQELVQVLAVGVHLFLRVNVLEQLGVVPPVGASLHHDGVRLELFNELLGSLGQHGAVVHCAD